MKILLTILLFAIPAFAQLTSDDAKTIRTLLAERDFYKQASEDATDQKEAWKRQVDEWKKLYEAEKSRADVTQGSRIEELQKVIDNLNKANGELFRANQIYLEQSRIDLDRMKSQDSKIASLKSQRKWYFVAGAGAGFLGGRQLK